MVDSAELIQLMMLNTIGMSILTKTLYSASRATFTNGDSNRTERQQCYMFIQGTGLEALIDRFDLGIEADSLRMGFNYLYRRDH